MGLAQFLAPTESKHYRVLVPAVAYFVRFGPFAATWVRLGFDPRTTPESRLYQSVEVKCVIVSA